MTEHKIGVGPHARPWPNDSKYDLELLEHGDKRNVLDRYRYWSNDAIKADLDETRVNLHVAIENWQHDFNIGTIVRNANAFNVKTVHIIGKKHYNRRGAMVTDKYLNIVHHATVEEFVSVMNQENRQIYVVDIISGAVNLSETKLPSNIVLVFGGEGPGVSSEMQAKAKKVVMIEQFGSTRSVNVGVASGIAMYMWVHENILTHHI